MKARTLFRENGTVIHTRTPILERLQPWVLAFVVAAVVLVLPGLLDPLPPHDDAGALVDLLALHEQELLAMRDEVARAYLQGQSDARHAMPAECKRGSQL